MPEKPNIRWRKSDIEKIANEVKRYNKKISRIANANPEMRAILPQSKSVRDLKNNITTRAEFNRELRSIDRFFRKGALKVQEFDAGLKVTAYERKEIQIKVNLINRQRTLEKKNSNMTPETGTITRIKERNFDAKPFHPQKMRGGKSWREYVKSVEKQARDKYLQDKMDLYKKHYLETIKKNLGKDGKELYKLVKSIDAKTIYENFYEDPVLQIQFISDPLSSKVIADESLTRWKEILSWNELLEYSGKLQNIDED